MTVAKRFWQCKICGQWNGWLRLTCLTKGCKGHKKDAKEVE